MSGQATGWVLRHGPSPKRHDLSAATARRWRAVLGVIADAANRDGEHSHPGMDAMIEGSLYSRAQVLKTVTELQEAGWIEQTETAAPGRATEFRLCMERVSERDTFGSQDEPRSGLVSRRNGSQNRRNGSQNETALPLLPSATVEQRKEPSADTSAEATQPDPARLILETVWERLDPKPSTPWPGMIRAVRNLLKAGWSTDELERACIEAPTISTGAVEIVLRRNRGQRRGPRQERGMVGRDGSSGRKASL